MDLNKLVLSMALVCGVGHAHAAPPPGVGDCVGPKITAVRKLPGGKTAFDGTPAPVFMGPGGASAGRIIAVGETFWVVAAQRGFLQVKASTNSGNLAPGAVVGWVATSSVTYFNGPHNCN